MKRMTPKWFEARDRLINAFIDLTTEMAMINVPAALAVHGATTSTLKAVQGIGEMVFERCGKDGCNVALDPNGLCPACDMTADQIHDRLKAQAERHRIEGLDS